MTFADGQQRLEAYQWTGTNFDAIEAFVGRPVKRIGRWNLQLDEDDKDTIVSKDDYIVKSDCYPNGIGVENQEDWENAVASGADIYGGPTLVEIDLDGEASMTGLATETVDLNQESDYAIIENMLERHEAALREDSRSLTKIRARDAIRTLLSLLPREG